MATNLSDDGKYPVDHDFWPPFDHFWKEDLSHIPEAPLKWRDREPYRIFAKKTYDYLTHSDALQDLVTTAYEDGYEDGKHNKEKNIVAALKGMKNEYPQFSDFIDQIVERIKLV